MGQAGQQGADRRAGRARQEAAKGHARGAAQRLRAVPEPARGLSGEPDLRWLGDDPAEPRAVRVRGGVRGALADPRPGPRRRRAELRRGEGSGEGPAVAVGPRSEERRVGKGCRTRWSTCETTKNEEQK